MCRVDLGLLLTYQTKVGLHLGEGTPPVLDIGLQVALPACNTISHSKDDNI